MTYYLYFSHTGDYYTEDHELTDEELYCDGCMDSDELMSTFTNRSELIQHLVLDGAFRETIDYVVGEWEKSFYDRKVD